MTPLSLIDAARSIARDMEAAHEEWGANCGPSALAAITCRTLAMVRPHMGDFEKKGYTNPTLMFAALRSMGVRFEHRRNEPQLWPVYGLARIQWHGPWMDPGVPIRARYRQSHWVAAMRRGKTDIGIFDCNALANGTGWGALADWERVMVPAITAEIPRANGEWSITHSIGVYP